MKNISNLLQYVPKRFSMVLAGLLVLVIPAAMAAASWSPERPTYTINEPANHVTFNSIVDNPNYGDERTFHDAKDATITTEGGFKDVVEVNEGQEILLRAYVHNNAAANLNLVAENTRARFLIPTDASTNLRTISYVSADNASPKTVSDTVDYHADQAFSLEYVAGSATQYTNAVPSGFSLSDNIVNDGGALIGYNQADGKVQGCFEFSSIVTIKVKVKMASIDIEKDVRKAGDTSWSDSISNIKPGTKLEYRLKITNGGSDNVTGLTVGDNLPGYVHYIKDSAIAYDNATPGGRKIGNNLTSGGVTLDPTYAPGSVVYIMFEATIDKMPERCGTVQLINVGIAGADNAKNVQDKATTVVVTGRECEKEEFTYQCTSLSAVQSASNRLSFAFTTKVNHSANVSVNKYIYDFGVAGEDKVHTDKNQITKVYKDYGKYNVNVEVLFNVDGVQKSDTCSTSVEVMKTPPPPVTPPPTTPPPTTELPNTGPAQVLAGLFGTGALSYGAMTLSASRSGLRDKILGKE